MGHMVRMEYGPSPRIGGGSCIGIGHAVHTGRFQIVNTGQGGGQDGHQETGGQHRKRFRVPAPGQSIVNRITFGLGQHQHKQEGDDNRAGVDNDRRNAQKRGSSVQKQAGRAEQREGEP